LSLTCYSIFKRHKGNNATRNTKNCVFQLEPVLSILQQQKKNRITL